jgi:hypothetical protein
MHINNEKLLMMVVKETTRQGIADEFAYLKSLSQKVTILTRVGRRLVSRL